ncbi:MAG: hypothetical protein ACI35P_10485 [Bacillus sp. (in: firmicutes)]
MVEYDVSLQEKELFKEIIVENGVEKIAIWPDGEWSIYMTEHFKKRLEMEMPVYILDLREFISEYEFSDDIIEQLIEQLEAMLNENSRSI